MMGVLITDSWLANAVSEHAINVHYSHNQRELLPLKSFREDVCEWIRNNLESYCIVEDMTIKGAMEAEIRFRNQKEPSLKLDENQYINAIGNNGTDFDHVMIHAACNVLGVVIRKYTFYDNDEVKR